VGEIERTMSFRELLHWGLFELARPLPDELADLHSALISTVVVNLTRSADAPPAQMADFLMQRRPLPEAPRAPRELSEAEKFRAALAGGGS